MSHYNRDTLKKIDAILANSEREIMRLVKTPVKLFMEMRPDVMPSEDLIKDCLTVMARALKMSSEDYTIKSREARYVDLRQVATLLLKKYYPSLTLVEIARTFRQDHTSIIHSLRTAANRLESNDEMFVLKYQDADFVLSEWVKNKQDNEIQN